MGDRQPTAVGMSDREGRGGDRLAHAEPPCRAPDQSRLAGSEVAADQDDVTRNELGRQPLAQGLSLGGALSPDVHPAQTAQPPKRPIWSGSTSRSLTKGSGSGSGCSSRSGITVKSSLS